MGEIGEAKVAAVEGEGDEAGEREAEEEEQGVVGARRGGRGGRGRLVPLSASTTAVVNGVVAPFLAISERLREEGTAAGVIFLAADATLSGAFLLAPNMMSGGWSGIDVTRE